MKEENKNIKSEDWKNDALNIFNCGHNTIIIYEKKRVMFSCSRWILCVKMIKKKFSNTAFLLLVASSNLSEQRTSHVRLWYSLIYQPASPKKHYHLMYMM